MIARKTSYLARAARSEPADFLLLPLWFGLVTGLGEVALQGVRKFLLHRIIRVSPDIVWMSPLADVILFAIPGLLIFLAASWVGKLASLRIAVFMFAFLGYMSGLLMTNWMNYYAAVLLAAGLAVQTSRFIAGRSQQFHSLVRRTTPWMIAVVAGLTIGVNGWHWLTEYRAVAKLPPSPGSPNVLLIVLDTVRAQSLSAYGYARPTSPNLEQFAKTGVRFDRAIATAPWTLPSHASMFTGRWHHELSADWFEPLDDTYPTLAEALSAQGYVTAGFVANTHYCGFEHGLDRGFAYYQDYNRSAGQILVSSALGRTIGCASTLDPGCRLRKAIGYYEVPGRRSAAEVNAAFLGWLSKREQQPFFAFLNYFDAHVPLLPPEPFDFQFGPTKPRGNPMHLHTGLRSDLDSERWEWTSPEIEREMAAYDGTIAYLDYSVGLLLDEVKKRGLLENTLVIITSDHGEEFGEHDVMTHGNSLYLTSLHVPLLISFPSRVPAAVGVSEPVSLRDLPATVVDLLDVENKYRFPGNSLARHWDKKSEPGGPIEDPLISEVSGVSFRSEGYPISKGDMKSLLMDRYHYIRTGDGREELYDVVSDPWEKQNLTNSEELSPMLDRFRRFLEKTTSVAAR